MTPVNAQDHHLVFVTGPSGAGLTTEMRVLVTMDLPEGSAFGYFSVPLGNPESAR